MDSTTQQYAQLAASLVGSNDQDQDQIKETKSREIDFRAIQFPIHNFVECVNVDGETKLHNYRWPVEGTNPENPPKAIVMMFHGFGSYVGKYGHLAKPFIDAGYEVCGLDAMGFGHSGGIRGFIKDQDDFQRDGYNFMIKAQKFYQDLYPNKKVPIIGWGYSQGGKLVLGIQELLHKENNGDSFDAMILNTPNLKVQISHLDGEPMQIIKEAAESDPLKAIPWPFKPLLDSTFLVNYVKDELQFLGPHYGKTYYENIEIAEHIKENYQNITIPVHLVIASEDTVLCNEAMIQLMNTIKTSDDKKEIKSYPGDHYLLVDGWLYEDVIRNQISFLNRIL
eukprot:403341940